MPRADRGSSWIEAISGTEPGPASCRPSIGQGVAGAWMQKEPSHDMNRRKVK